MGIWLFAEPHFLDQRPGFGFVAAEAHVEFHRMLGTALRKDILTERAGDLAVEDALFLEEREGVRLQHLGPLVAVIPRGIATREDMSECRGHRRSGNYGQHLRRGHRCDLELLDIALEGSVIVCHAISVRPNESWRTLE